jgi:hypothetical protein
LYLAVAAAGVLRIPLMPISTVCPLIPGELAPDELPPPDEHAATAHKVRQETAATAMPALRIFNLLEELV